ncbi:MAG: sugar phosphate isomerase/epimerase, partial [Bacteroidota bacterium]|nr:sugar phosphate isomerase/epimerase [Bacteroidota bacterium]
LFAAMIPKNKIPVYGHLWVYASMYPPDWDCSPILDQVFSDFKTAGIQGVEMMEVHLRHSDVVRRVGDLIQKYGVPVSGISYYGDMWDRKKHQEISEDVELVVERMHKLGGSTFGITVGDAKRKKTEAELDAQGELLQKILKICNKNKVQPNLHNHTFEVENDLHDFKGTIERVPELKLGPDLNWLIRGGVDPVWFINTYGHKMVYLHIRDQDKEGKWTKAVGDGVTDFPAIAKALLKADFQGAAAIELAFEKTPVLPIREEWEKSRKYVNKVFGW